MNKLVRNSERDGTCYLEFQFCGIDEPLQDGKVAWKHLNYWREDSLYMYWDDFEEFYKLYEKVLSRGFLPNGNRGCDSCGINYYAAGEAEKLLEELSRSADEGYGALVPWLTAAVSRGKGFYILGV